MVKGCKLSTLISLPFQAKHRISLLENLGMFGEEYVILAMLLIAPSKSAYDKVDFDRGQTKRRAEDRAQILTPLSPSLSFCVCSVCAMRREGTVVK